MREFNLDASEWTSVLDFYYALLPTLEAPRWHGASVDALIDSMIWGGINAVEPPYAVRIYRTENLPENIVSELRLTAHHLAEARKELQAQEGHDVEVSMEIVDGSSAEGREGDPASVPVVMTTPPLSRDESEAMYGLPKRAADSEPAVKYQVILLMKCGT